MPTFRLEQDSQETVGEWLLTPLPVIERLRVSLPDSMPDEPPREDTCQRPGCRRSAEQRHHIVGRSYIKATVDFVLIDGLLVRNVADLCWNDHDRVESAVGGCKSRIRWIGERALWVWYDRTDPDPYDNKAGIWWVDSKSNTVWSLRGYLKGDATLWLPRQ